MRDKEATDSPRTAMKVGMPVYICYAAQRVLYLCGTIIEVLEDGCVVRYHAAHSPVMGSGQRATFDSNYLSVTPVMYDEEAAGMFRLFFTKEEMSAYFKSLYESQR